MKRHKVKAYHTVSSLSGHPRHLSWQVLSAAHFRKHSMIEHSCDHSLKMTAWNIPAGAHVDRMRLTAGEQRGHAVI